MSKLFFKTPSGNYMAILDDRSIDVIHLGGNSINIIVSELTPDVHPQVLASVRKRYSLISQAEFLKELDKALKVLTETINLVMQK